MRTLFLSILLACGVAQATYIPFGCPLNIANKCWTQSQITAFESGTTGNILHTFTATSLRFTSLRVVQGTTGLATAYQVGGAVTWRAVALKIFSAGGAAASAQLGYCDDEATFDDTACTNFVYQMGNGLYAVGAPASGFANSTGEVYLGSGWVVPANKYPICLGAGGNVGCQTWATIQ